MLFSVALAGPIQVPAYDPARSFGPLVKAVAAAVVTIEEGDDSVESHRGGSGFLVGAEGLILTNNHVIELFHQVRVRLPDGRTLAAERVGSDPAMDIAVLRVTGADLPWLQLANSRAARVGDRVLTLGYPLGLGLSATAGIISGTGRDLRQDVFYQSDDYLQTDAAINQGNSGGPLFDLDGNVVGMNTAIIDNVNTIGFAIPAHQLRFAIDEISAHGRIRRGYIGLKAAALSKEGATTRGLIGGAVVQEVLKKSPAKKAGLRAGDVVTHVGGKALKDDLDFMAIVGNHQPGDRIELTVLRKQTPLQTTLVLGALE